MKDPGLQPQRASLAWTRTLLALLACTLLVWRAWAHHPSASRLVVAVVATAAAVTLGVLSGSTVVLGLTVLCSGKAR